MFFFVFFEGVRGRGGDRGERRRQRRAMEETEESANDIMSRGGANSDSPRLQADLATTQEWVVMLRL